MKALAGDKAHTPPELNALNVATAICQISLNSHIFSSYGLELQFLLD